MHLSRSAFAVALCLAVLAPTAARACSSCGCTLSSDWASQGYSAGPGWRVDFRYDYFNQDQLRSGTHSVDRSSITLPTDQEIQQFTVNRNYTLTLDYSPNENWGVNVQLPYFDRFHGTIAEGDTDISTSHTTSIGDVRVVARYQGLTADHTLGLQFGIKLPTGSIHNVFSTGPQAGQPLDRGLQPGTGTTDLLVGLYHFGAISRDWDYFAQVLLQQPLDTVEDFRPGTGLNANVGVRYEAFERVVPQLQINARAEKRESGLNADVDNSGATLVYLSPGVTVLITPKLQVYGFIQVPIYQRVNGLQIEPRYTASIGIHYSL